MSVWKFRIITVLQNHKPHRHEIWYFSTSVNSFFKRACGTRCLIIIYFHTSCVRTAKALARLCGCAGSPELSLVAYVMSTIISLMSWLKWLLPHRMGRVKNSGKPPLPIHAHSLAPSLMAHKKVWATSWGTCFWHMRTTKLQIIHNAYLLALILCRGIPRQNIFSSVVDDFCHTRFSFR